MAEPRKDRVLSRDQIGKIYEAAGLRGPLKRQRIAGNETGDRELPPVNSSIAQRKNEVLGVDQGRGRKQGNVIDIMREGHG